jgi:hypothetical protein
MKIQEQIDTLLAGSTRLGTFTLPKLMKFVQSKSMDGIAVAVTIDRKFYLAIQDGEPEGAILVDEKGTLYGDKAVMLLSGNETFELYDVKRDFVEGVVAGCRIMEKGHIRKRGMDMIPEIGKKSDGLGVISIAVQRNGEPQNGLRVSIRKDRQMFCNDVTTQNGTVGFRLLYGKYDCVVQDRDMTIHTFHIIFDVDHTRITLEL